MFIELSKAVQLICFRTIMASNMVVLVTGLLTPLCTNFLAFSVRMCLIFIKMFLILIKIP